MRSGHLWGCGAELSLCAPLQVRLVIAEKGLPCEERDVSMPLLEHKEPWFMRLNLGEEVPVIIHRDNIISDYNQIIDYMERNFTGGNGGTAACRASSQHKPRADLNVGGQMHPFPPTKVWLAHIQFSRFAIKMKDFQQKSSDIPCKSCKGDLGELQLGLPFCPRVYAPKLNHSSHLHGLGAHGVRWHLTRLCTLGTE